MRVTAQTETRGVVLRAGESGASILRGLVERALADFPDVFERASLAEGLSSFKARYPELLPRFEAARAQSERRAEIARALYLEAAERLCYRDLAPEGARPARAEPERAGAAGPSDGARRPEPPEPVARAADPSAPALRERPLFEAFCAPSRALPRVRVDLSGPRRFVPSADFEGRIYIGGELEALARALDQRRLITSAAADALRFVARRALSGGLTLAGERFVLLGAAAELSPVYALLAAGAEVLWLDLQNPPIDHLLEPHLSGALHYIDGGADLLTQPAEIRATILEFAAGSPVHLGLYAFANGGARELRLGFTMCELARSLPRELVKSLAFLLSPTSVSPISAEDAERADLKQRSASKVQRALLRAGPLSPGQLASGDLRIACSILPQQGAAFQVAEYAAKRLSAEAFFAFGSALAEPRPGSLSVSANMAPVAATRTLASPLLEAALLGAASYEMMLAPPSTARAIAGLLLLHDRLNPELGAPALSRQPLAAQMNALFARQFHGGLYAQPFALEGILRVAALRGLAQRPKLALGLLR